MKRLATGEKTYSATALESALKRKKFWESYKRFEEMAAKGDFFWPGYLKELRPNAYSVKPPARQSAREK
jgi:hypothetical protein